MKNKIIFAGAVFGFLGVTLGAFGAHVLKNTFTPEQFDNFRTGIMYQLVHAVVLISIGFSGIQKLFKAAYFFIAGVILFSFSLYIYTICNLKFAAMFAPFGGVSFMIGWILLIIYSLKKES
ncbi:MAG: DUF423 domain-containing protein [Ignavibacteria bacterium]|nr:DUF423 domain-containing protein [Ignavibacteria bacterium]